MTIVFLPLVLLLAAALAVAGILLVKQHAAAAVLAERLKDAESGFGQQMTQMRDQLDKCRTAYASLKGEAEADVQRLKTATSELTGRNSQLLKYEQGYRDLKAKAEEHIRSLMVTVSSLKKRSESAEQTVAIQSEQMKRWQTIVDAEAEASRVREKAQGEATDLRTKADRILAEAQSRADSLARDSEAQRAEASKSAQAVLAEANAAAEQTWKTIAEQTNDMLAKARKQAHELTEHAKRVVEEAESRAGRLVAEAEEKAKEIAGEAYEVKQNTAKYERALKAVKNQIEGYGDEYIIPSHSLLDDLADEFGFAEAGKELKAARELVKSMVKKDDAAQCDYVEANRRETAVRFVVDAFNGKVDSILSTVKHDNFGKLSQQIKDAFTIVNANGEAFRNARITERYLEARLNELKWAVIVHELKKQEQEEQRRIKERIREEEKARREYERAIKEATREEELVQKAMTKLQDQMAKASEAERAKYEAQLLEMQEKLRAAEEKGQRAISMAQQTKSGHVYIISNIGSFGEHVYKIGLTRRLDPHDRIRELGDSSVPFEFDVHALIKAEDAPALENQLHKHFVLHQVNKVNHRKEFFRCDLSTIRGEVEKLGLEAHWTMAATAQDYRETLAIERKIADDPLARERWVQRQLELDPTDGGEVGENGELVGAGVSTTSEDEEA
jgi:hypothetical protein